MQPFPLVTAWRVLENKIATKVNLEKRGIVLDSPLCSFCRVEEKSCRHLFFECRFAWLVWSHCFEWIGVQFVSHNVPLLNFFQFKLINASGDVRGAVWIVVVSELWKHRNNVSFNRGVADVSEVFVLVQLKAWSWVTAKSHAMLFFFSNWCLDPLVCMRMIC